MSVKLSVINVNFVDTIKKGKGELLFIHNRTGFFVDYFSLLALILLNVFNVRLR